MDGWWLDGWLQLYASMVTRANGNDTVREVVISYKVRDAGIYAQETKNARSCTEVGEG
jgi:hypothetical protein